MVQYYYDKHNINEFWDTQDVNSIDTEIIIENTETKTSVSGDRYEDFYPDVYSTCMFEDNYDVVVDFSKGSYDSYKLDINGNCVEVINSDTINAKLNVDVGDKLYDYENGVLVEYELKDYLLKNYGAGSIIDYKLDSMIVTRLNEIELLDEYTIYLNQEKGTYIETVVADDGTYPEDGVQNGYWWVKTTKPEVTLDAIGNKFIDEGQTLSFTTTASIDGTSTITFTVNNLPNGASYDSSGNFNWDTDYYDEGTYDVTFTATANGTTDSETITITVNHVDIEPSLDSIGNKSVDENNNLNFQVRVTDPDDVGYTLSANGLPSGANFDTVTGEFDWTPTYMQSGSYNITFEITYTANSTTNTDSETITVTVNEIHQPPNNRSPDTNTETNNRQPYFEFVLPANDESDSLKYHAKFRISTTSDMNNLIIDYDSKDDQSQWELWDGSQWVTFPSGGVNPDSKIRVKPDFALQYGFLYWNCASWETNYGYGLNTSTWKINILISTNKPYVLTIEGTEYNAYSINVSETSNGEVGSIDFVLNNQDGTANTNINYNDTILLAVNDKLGNQEQFKGIIRDKNPEGKILNISAITGDGILSERRVKQNYSGQDIGLTQKQIIDNYCSPLSSNNINTTGITATIKAKDKTPLKIFEEIRRQFGIFYFVDANWDVNTYFLSEIGSSVVTVRHGD